MNCRLLIFVLAFVCQTHHITASRYRDLTARSCLDYFKKGYKTNGYYQVNYKENGLSNFYTAYCDMESEPGSAWTLVESFALKNKAMPAFRNHPLKTNAPVLPKSPNWNLYRMSFSQMDHLKTESTHWRVTCNFQTKPDYLYRDYAVARFRDFDALTFEGRNVCKKMKYINIRGHECAECTAGWYAILNGDSLHVDSPSTGCQFQPNRGAVQTEDNFGLYLSTNNKFRCTSSAEATTNFWFGGYF